jgi:CHAD domain-containing protein
VVNASKLVSKGARKLARRVRTMTRRWDLHPTEQATHEVRVAIRRFRTAIALLPRPARKHKRVRRFEKSAQALFRKLAVIRDLDVVTHHFEDLDAPDDVFDAVARERERAVDAARARATEVIDIRRPRVQRKELDDEDIERRATDVVRRAGIQLRELLPIVLANGERTEVVHEARKAGRVLRYVYELLAPDGDARRLPWATALQALLGELHDRDMAIARMLAESDRTPETTRALLQQHADRAARHEELATFIRRTPDLLDVVAPIA